MKVGSIKCGKKEKRDVEWMIDKNGIKRFVASYKEALALAEKMDKKIDIYDFIVRRNARVVAVQHMDGSYLEFHSACFRKLSKDFFAVFTEHHGTKVYHREDVEFVREWLKPKSLYYNEDI